MECVGESEFNKELWRRVELEQFLGYEVCRQFGLSQADYINTVCIQLELPYV